ncbi:nitroreductase family deazaflavin-dependent oxidoreductase [Nocardioides limicola]|uniref:nitroreductase family deazaflavin-dependent oxidoreductase n=1 Tax=Nocardioides limicola TaxID=2803368 RepID=UPI00193C23BF|nr:nitroreductase family deazaflavin-dependent oxidoreductase [Nocardioides sp. DJM-14]
MPVPNPMRPLAIRIGALPWLHNYSRYVVGLDKGIRKLTRGRVTLLWFAGLPEIFLTVAGRKSGIPRTVPLLCVPHDGGWLVAGSNWGHPKPPAWVGNVKAAATCEVEQHGRTVTAVPRLVTGAERAEVWQTMLRTWPNYAKYAERTDREIPVFHLAPH